MKFLQIIIYSCALLLSFHTYASEEQYNERREGEDLVAGASFELFDDKYFDMAINPLWGDIFAHRSVKNYVRLGLDPGVVQSSNMNGSMVVKVTYERWTSNGFIVTQVNRTLSLNYSTIATDRIDDLSTFSFTNAHRIRVEIVSMTNLDADRIFLESGIDVDRVYAFDRSTVNGYGRRYLDVAGAITPDISQAREFEFFWSTKQGAEFYELEWVYINNYTLDNGIMISPADLNYNFYLNSTRIETTNTFYRIPNIFNKGYVLFRVRAIGRQGVSLDEREEGAWNIAESGTVASFPLTMITQISQEYDQAMNWVHQVTYTEGGKRFEAISFSDGLGRSRQSVAKNSETKQVVVSNVYYDDLGRVAVSDLPTPVNGDYMHHFPNFNRSETAGEPSYMEDYFYTDQGTTCPLVTQGFSPNFGAGKYYSPNNPDQDGENAQIPDAEKYPFNSVSYLSDFTGRVDKVGSAGSELTLGRGHETQYWYPSVNQGELNELFGVEAGDYTHYQKMMTLDANGQIYVEITDMAGRVVASYMEGVGPSTLDAIEDAAAELEQVDMLVDGAPQNVDPNGMFSELTYYQAITTAGEHDFTYAFRAEQFEPPACVGHLCFDCLYDLTIEIYDNCGDLVHEVTKTGFNGDAIYEACNGYEETMPEDFTFTKNFTKLGVYTIKKRLSLNMDLVDEYWCAYADNENCTPSLPDIFNDLYAEEDFPGCEEEISMENYSECDYAKLMMLEDMKPGGQYGAVEEINGIYTATDEVSVYNSNSLLEGNWTAAGFLDADNQPITSLTYLINNFQDEWAEALLPYHPEYCFFEACIALETFRTYDNSMNEIYSFGDARNQGFFIPLEEVIPIVPEDFKFNDGDPDNDEVMNLDPFFSSTTGSDFLIPMRDRMRNYITIGGVQLNIYQYVIILENCPELLTQSTLTYSQVMSCVSDFNEAHVSCHNDMIWIAYREAYQELKEEFYQLYRDNSCPTQSNCIEVATPCDNSVRQADPYLADKVSRWGNSTGFSTDPDDLITQFENDFATGCQSACQQYAAEWMQKLENCHFTETYGLTQVQKDAMQADFVTLCASGCGMNLDPLNLSVHPMPASTSPSGTSINDIILAHIPTFQETDLCSELLISDPKPYESMEETQSALFKPADCCTCEKLNAIRTEFLALQNSNSLPAGVRYEEQLLSLRLGVEMDDMSELLDCYCKDCDPHNPFENTLLNEANILVPAVLACEVNADQCKDCSTFSAKLTELSGRIEDYEDSPNYEVILTNFMNREFGFDLKFKDYEAFMGKCAASVETPYCEVNPLLEEWSDMAKLLAMRDQLVSATALNLDIENIVYTFGKLKEESLKPYYRGIASGNQLTMNFQAGSTYNASTDCSFTLDLPENADFGFGDIVSFGMMAPYESEGTNPCGTNNDFVVEVSYYDCGQLVSAQLLGTNTCFPVKTCTCSVPADLKLCDAQPSVEEPLCYQPRLDELMHTAFEVREDQIAGMHDEFVAAYTAKCAEAFQSEDFNLKGNFGRYQQTLFYYDQAGNLVRTVAPEGVKGLDQTNNVAINAERAAVTSSATTADPIDGVTIPLHEYKTEYTYNSYNQLVNTSNPDQAGATVFWYDRYGRIVASQNPVQLDDQQYSYTLYDDQGRPVEVGQISLVQPGGNLTAFTNDDIRRDDRGTWFRNWVRTARRTEVTITTYDKKLSDAITLKFANQKQENLRLRVATVAYFDNVVPGVTVLESQYTSANHYSYDLHGNVIEQLQDVPMLVPVKQDIKSTQYDFELISGNVKEVHYQEDKLDGITHHYEYDKLNRLTEVFTTTDRGVHQTREAHYHYYDYGPLARVETGKSQVQAMDFAYTINGWLKGANSSLLKEDYDIGKDGISGYLAANTSVHGLFAKDVLAYTIGYYNRLDENSIYHPDYKAISSASAFEASYAGQTFDLAAPNLYNGNIRHLVTSITGMQAMGSVYKYDQLQRLKEMKAFYNTNTANNWAGVAAPSEDYYNSYSYDKNGNLEHLKRNAGNGELMDDFGYEYFGLDGVNNTSSLSKSNRLDHIVEGTTVYDGNEDLENQNVGNYVYDKLGQLTKDNSEGIAVYTWRKGDKKLQSITRDVSDPDGSNVDFIYNPFGQRVLKIVKPRSGGILSQQADWEYSYYAYDANGQVMAVYDLENPLQTTGKALLTEEHLYGASRLGMIQGAKVVYNGGVLLTKDGPVYQNEAGARAYEITNHLGNVNVVITDRKMPLTGGIGALYEAVSIQTTDYYPFGMMMPGRNPNPSGYRYAYNGMEVDNEIKPGGNSYTTEFRQYDPRLGRWLSVDPIMMLYPNMSPYCAFDNNPIFYVDPLGLEGGDKDGKAKGNGTEDNPKQLNNVDKGHKLTNQQKLNIFMREMKKIGDNPSLSFMEKERARTKAQVRFYRSIGRNHLAGWAQAVGGVRLGIMSAIVPVISNPFKSRKEINQAGLKLARQAKRKRTSVLMTIVVNKIEAESKAQKTRDTQDWIEFVTEKVTLIAGGLEAGLAIESYVGGVDDVAKVADDLNESKFDLDPSFLDGEVDNLKGQADLGWYDGNTAHFEIEAIIKTSKASKNSAFKALIKKCEEAAIAAGLKEVRIDFKMVVNSRLANDVTWAKEYGYHFTSWSDDTGALHVTWEKTLK